MPKRQSIKNIPTPELQGDDSFIKYRPMTFEEAQSLQETTKALQSKMDNVLSDYAKSLDIKLDALTDEQKNTALTEAGLDGEAIDFMHKRIAEHIIEWNWVDDEDKPLPQPKDDYTILRKLYGPEHNFIMELFTNQNTNPKN